jgi:hypothetical protein
MSTALAVLALPVNAAEQTLKQQVQGVWNLVSCDAKVPTCASPNGSLSLNGNGRYTAVVVQKNRSVPATGTQGTAPRDKITPEEYKTIGQGTVAQFGTWSLDEATKTLTLHSEDGFIPRRDRPVDFKATIVSVTADEMKTGGLLGNSVYRRFK